VALAGEALQRWHQPPTVPAALGTLGPDALRRRRAKLAPTTPSRAPEDTP